MRVYILRLILVLIGMTTVSPVCMGAESSTSATINRMFWRGCHFLVDEANFDSAMFYFQRITQQFDNDKLRSLSDRDQTLVARSYNNCAYINMYMFNNYGAAIRNLVNAERICNEDTTRVTLQLYLGYALTVYALGMPTMENQQLAESYYRVAFDGALKLGMPMEMAAAYLSLFSFGFDEKELQRNREFTNYIIKQDPSNDAISRYTRLFSLGVNHLDNKKPEDALADFRLQSKCLPMLEQDPHYSMLTNRNIALTFGKMGQKDSLLYYANLYWQQAQQYGMTDERVIASRMLSECYQEMGNKEQAEHFNLIYHQLRDSLIINNQLTSLHSSGLIEKLKQQVNDEEAEETTNWPYILIAIVVIVLLFVAFYVLWIRRRRKQKETDSAQPIEEQQTDTSKYQYSTLSEDRKDDIYNNVMKVMNDIEAISNPDFSILTLVGLCHANQKYISQVINERTGNNFSSLLTEYRIKEACRRMQDKENYGSVTLEYIAQSVGFKSRSGFLKAFKRVKGIPPSEF